VDALAIRELFAEFGPVDVRRMFGGVGVFVEGRMIALVSRAVIYLKADAETIPDFEREGLAPFSYGTRNGERKHVLPRIREMVRLRTQWLSLVSRLGACLPDSGKTDMGRGGLR
jgi:TfoX/Sxy family transcriptional regulator of competence genes